MSVFDQICHFANWAWYQMLCYHGIEGADCCEYEVSALIVEFFSVVNSV